MAKRSAAEEWTQQYETSAGDILEIMPLGAGNEVGRSCILVGFKGKKIMLDCGIHPAYAGLAGLPFFDEIDDASSIDLLLVSHFHLDHAAALPYFLAKTTFKGRVFMTHPTKAIYKMLLTDYVKVSNIAVEDILYNEDDLKESMDKIDQIDYHQEREYNGIKFWCYNAGHVLGAAMFMVEIAGVRILYTGDFSRQEDRHLMAAETPVVKPDILIVESTYGVQIHEPRKERETRFTTFVHDIVRRGGRCLLPVFALGRAQELLLILDEYWEAHRELRNVPIYYASTLAKKCMKVYQTYINMMNEKIRKQFAIDNPFVFKHISSLKGMDQFEDSGPSVVMASPGMLQSGLSRELFETWCSDKKNGVILSGYSVEGTLAKHIMSEPKEITTLAGVTVPLHLSIHYISFSAHSDFKQTSEFIDILQPPFIILVHGDANEMSRLKGALVERYSGKNNTQILTPKNCQTIRLRFRAEKTAKVIGSLADQSIKKVKREENEEEEGKGKVGAEDGDSGVCQPSEGEVVSGLIIEKNFVHHIIAPQDLRTYTQLSVSTVTQRLSVSFHRPFSLLKSYLSGIFEDVRSTTIEEKEALVVRTAKPQRTSSSVSPSSSYEVSIITTNNSNNVQLVWLANPVTDMLADSLISFLLQLETNPTVAVEPTPPSASDSEITTSRNVVETNGVSSSRSPHIVKQLLKAHFGKENVLLGSEEVDNETTSSHVITVLVDGITVKCDCISLEVTSKDAQSQVAVESVKTAFLRSIATLKPIS